MKSAPYIALAAALSLAACGTPGAPRPPSLRLPETVRDLAIARQGSTVTLSWTEPQRTTDGENIRALGPTLVCMGVNDFPMTHCDQMVADLTLAQYASCKPEIAKPASCAVTLPFEVQQQNPRGQATYAIEVLNTNGRSAGLSNQVRVPTAPTLAAPQNIRAEVTADAVVVNTGVPSSTPWFIDAPNVSPIQNKPWPNVWASLHVYRESDGHSVDLGIASFAAASFPGGKLYKFVDRSFEWEKTYLYRVAAVTTVSLPDGTIVDVRGDPTPDVKVFTQDIFPPATPQGLQAVASGVGQQPFIDLTWAPNTDADLAGYNVFRHEEGQPPVKINSELVKTPAYRDAKVERGKTYFYAVTAGDLRNNESSKSQEASETVH